MKKLFDKEGYVGGIANGELMIRTVGLTKDFGELHVLKGINEEIYKGEVVSIIGPSGSGKSTFLRCLNRLEEATSGEIYFEGVNILDKSADINVHRQKMGMVFQQFNVFPNMSVKENITMAPVLLKKKTKEEADAMAEELLARVGLLDKKDERPSRLSGGQKQRLAIVRALAMEPVGFPPHKLLHVHMALPVHLRPEAGGQGIDAGNAHAVEAAGDLVAPAAELAAGVEDGQSHREGVLSGFFMVAHGDAPAVVRHGDGLIGVDIDFDMGAEACQGLVDGVVHHLRYQMVQTPGVGGADVHARPSADCLQPLQHLDLGGVVILLVFPDFLLFHATFLFSNLLVLVFLYLFHRQDGGFKEPFPADGVV